MLKLTDEQKSTVQEYITGFKEFLKTPRAQEWDQERKERTKSFQRVLSPNSIQRLSEEEFGEIVKSLWASLVWSDKNYKTSQLLEDNDIETIRQELAFLLYRDTSVAERYDRFRKRIKGLGPSSITEILVFVQPQQHCLWNEKPKTVLPFLGLDSLLPSRVFKYQITGSDYIQCTRVLSLIRDELQGHGFKNADFIDVDFFLAYIFYEVIKKQAQPQIIEELRTKRHSKIDISKLTHWDAIGMLVVLGNLLGFDTYVADPNRKYDGKPLKELVSLEEPPEEFKGIKDVERVDVIWFNKFTPPSYFFEVEDGGNMRDALQRLFQASHFNARFFIVAPSENRPKFDRWAKTAPYKHMRYHFKSYEELTEFFEEVRVFTELRTSFLG